MSPIVKVQPLSVKLKELQKEIIDLEWDGKDISHLKSKYEYLKKEYDNGELYYVPF